MVIDFECTVALTPVNQMQASHFQMEIWLLIIIDMDAIVLPIITPAAMISLFFQVMQLVYTHVTFLTAVETTWMSTLDSMRKDSGVST